MSEVDFNNLKPLKIAKSKGKFKTFTNGSIIEGENMPQPYLGKPLTVNINEIYIHNLTATCIIEVLINNEEKLSVVDIIKVDAEGKILEISAYKQQKC